MNFPATREQLKCAGYEFVFARLCKKCDRPLEFYRTPGGKLTPLEPTVVNKEWVMESHFRICPFAEEFRKQAPEKKTKQGDLFGDEK